MSQFRSNNKRSFFSRVMTFYYRKTIGYCGAGVSFDTIVYLMRNKSNISIDDGAYIKSGARLCPCNKNAKIEIGRSTTVGYNTMIFASEAISIGDDCMIAPNVYLVDSDHGMELGKNMNQQENSTAEIKIGNDVWIASGVTVLKGTVIPDGCVIAANSLVKGELEENSIYGGTPIKKLGVRH